MTTLDASRKSLLSLFSVYKPGQGKYVRWGTVGALGLALAAGMWWTNDKIIDYYNPGIAPIWRATILSAIAVIGAVMALLIVNLPRPAEFMIMTESEMRKVTWPSRQAVISSTKVVIFLTFLMAAILWFVDYGFVELFKWMGILSN